MPIEISQVTLIAPAFEISSFGQTGSGSIHINPDGSPAPKDSTPTEFQANRSPKVDCWRLVHDGSAVLALFQSAGETTTRQNLFCGTLDECNAEITAKGLDRTAYDAEQIKLAPRPRPAPATPPTPPSPTVKVTADTSFAAADNTALLAKLQALLLQNPDLLSASDLTSLNTIAAKAP